MTDDAGLAAELEEIAARVWPAAEEAPLGGWRLRASAGVTRRGNSVWPNADDGSTPLDAKQAAAEAFYAARRLPARFQMTVAARPAGLDAALAARGYALECPCRVMTAVTAAVLRRRAASPARARSSSRPRRRRPAASSAASTGASSWTAASVTSGWTPWGCCWR